MSIDGKFEIHTFHTNIRFLKNFILYAVVSWFGIGVRIEIVESRRLVLRRSQTKLGMDFQFFLTILTISLKIVKKC